MIRIGAPTVMLTAVDKLISDFEKISHGHDKSFKGRMFHLIWKVSLEEGQSRIDDVEATLQHEVAALVTHRGFDILKQK